MREHGIRGFHNIDLLFAHQAEVEAFQLTPLEATRPRVTHANSDNFSPKAPDGVNECNRLTASSTR
jgi:hypothetical protein